jgi:hypothetical protein
LPIWLKNGMAKNKKGVIIKKGLSIVDSPFFI